MGKSNKEKKGLIYNLRSQIREDRTSFIVYSVLRTLVILTAVRCFFQNNYEGLALCVLSLVLFLLPALFERALRINIPAGFEITIYLFIFAAEILGEINKYYTRIPGWDTMLHTLNGFLCAAIGFSLVYILNASQDGLNLSPFYLTVVAFCFSMTVGVVWEFIEFSADQLFHLDMQKDFIVGTISSVKLDPENSQVPFMIKDIANTIIETKGGEQFLVNGGYLDIGIIDTMKDLFVNLVGALTYSIFGYFYLKHSKAGKEMNRQDQFVQSMILQKADSGKTSEEDK